MATKKIDPKTAAKKKPARRPPRVRLNSPELVKVLLTVDEAAHKLSIGRTSVYRLMNRGDLGYILVGGTRRVPVESVSQYVSQQLQRSRRAIA